MRCASSNLPCASKVATCSSSLLADLLDRLFHAVLRRDEVLGREDVHLLVVGHNLAGERVDLADALDLVAPQADAVGGLAVGRLYLQHVAAHAEAAALQEVVVAVVVDLDQVAQHLVAAHHLAHAQMCSTTRP